MPVTADRPGPYTSPKAIADIVRRHRDRGLPSPVSADTLRRAGVSESLIPRTLQSLVGLDLITEEGQITEVFERLRLAPEAEFQRAVKEWLDATYADILQFVDPATAVETEVHDAFRNYKPVGQRDRMVSLFLNLYEMAGVSTAKASVPRVRSRPAAVRIEQRTRPAPKVVREPVPNMRYSVHSAGGFPPAISGLLQSLPPEGTGWTQAKRDSFMNALGVVMDFCFPIISEAQAEENE